MKAAIPQFEFGFNAFNLAAGTTEDGARIAQERNQVAADRAQASKQQTTLERWALRVALKFRTQERERLCTGDFVTVPAGTELAEIIATAANDRRWLARVELGGRSLWAWIDSDAAELV